MLINLIIKDNILCEEINQRKELFGSTKFVFNAYTGDFSTFDYIVMPSDLYLSLQLKLIRPSKIICYGPANLLSLSYISGCVDYIKDPWTIEELACRITYLNTLEFNTSKILMKLDRNKISCCSYSEFLSDDEGKVLDLLVVAKGSPVSVDTLELAVYGFKQNTDSKAISMIVSRLRKKINSILPIHNEEKMILYIKNYGYAVNTNKCGILVDKIV